MKESTFLYNNQRSGRSENEITISGQFKIRQRYRLPTAKVCASETMPITNEKGEIFFGTHDGIFYCLHPDFKLKWFFNTQSNKIYASPTLCSDSRIYFASGNNIAFCLDANDGELLWSKSLWKTEKRLAKSISILINAPFYRYFNRTTRVSRCWSSPVIVGDKAFFIGALHGLICIDRITGVVEENFPLGFPKNYWSSPVSFGNTVYFTDQRSFLYALNVSSHEILWKSRIAGRGDFVGNLSYGKDLNYAFATTYLSKNSGSVAAVSSEGDVMWTTHLGSGFRGGATVSEDKLYALGSNGMFFIMNAKSGEVLNSRLVEASSGWLGHWTTPVLSANDCIVFGAVSSPSSGALICLNNELEVIARFDCNKVLSPPLITENGSVVFGHWGGEVLEVTF